MNQLIRCINCDAIFLETPYDRCPEYEFDSDRFPESFRVIEKDDFQDFLKNHRGHHLENLKILEDSFISEKPYDEPIKISYFKATNGKEEFVIKKFRENIHQPLRYQLIHGDYSLKVIHLEIQSEEIEKQLKIEFKKYPLPQNKIDAFLRLYEKILKTIDLKNLERVPEESSLPVEIYYRMDDVSLAYLLRNCRHIFKGQEYQEIEAFIHRHKDDGVLLLKARFQIQLSRKARAKKKITASPFAMEKAVEKK